MTEKKFTVNGMKCAGCVAAVETTLNNLKGVENATANLADKSTLIKYDESITSPEALKKEVNSLGFEMLIDE